MGKHEKIRETKGRPCEDEASKIDWVIVGGESGPGARPCYVQWIRSIKGQCRLANVACFVKQVGAFPVIKQESEWETPTRHLKLQHGLHEGYPGETQTQKGR